MIIVQLLKMADEDKVKQTVNVDDNTDAPVMSKEQTYDANKANLTKFSGFFITLNSNRKWANDSEETKCFKEAVNTAFNDPSKFVKFKDASHKWSAKYIIDANTEISFERGDPTKPTKNQIHAHVILKIKHRSNLQIDAHALKIAITERCPALNGSFYINNRYFNSPEVNLRNYIQKQTELTNQARERKHIANHADARYIAVKAEPPPMKEQ